jgi:hypothetical protein
LLRIALYWKRTRFENNSSLSMSDLYGWWKWPALSSFGSSRVHFVEIPRWNCQRNSLKFFVAALQ